MNYLLEKDFIIEQMKQAAQIKLDHTFGAVKQKQAFDLVTDLDVAIETFLIAQIKEKFPADTILSEEMNATETILNRTWTIDPIDGTCNLAHGSPVFGIQVALIENNEIVMCAIILPLLGEEYYAIKGQGAFLNGQPIQVAYDTQIQNSIVSFGDYVHSPIEIAQKQHESVKILYPQIAKIRMFGAACFDFAFVASAKTDATVVLTNNLWDIVPGILLCQEAGGIVSNLNAQPYQFGDFGVIISSNETLHNVIMGSLQ